jgi:hypothetical protein
VTTTRQPGGDVCPGHVNQPENRPSADHPATVAVGAADKRYYRQPNPSFVNRPVEVTEEGSGRNSACGAVGADGEHAIVAGLFRVGCGPATPEAPHSEAHACVDCGCQAGVFRGDPETCPYDHSGEETCIDCERVACDCACHEAAEALSRVALTPAGLAALTSSLTAADVAGLDWWTAYTMYRRPHEWPMVCREGREERRAALRSAWGKVARLAGALAARAENADEKGDYLARKSPAAIRARMREYGKAHAYGGASGDLRALARELAGGAS